MEYDLTDPYVGEFILSLVVIMSAAVLFYFIILKWLFNRRARENANGNDT
jgi:hypothetical protein